MQLWRQLMNFRVREFLKSAGKGLHHSCLVHFFNIASYASLSAMALNVCEKSPCKWPFLPSIRSNVTHNKTELWRQQVFFKKHNCNLFKSSSLIIRAYFCICCVIFPCLSDSGYFVSLYLVAFFTVWILMNFMTQLLSPLSLRSDQH